jgi:hypothetical protein
MLGCGRLPELATTFESVKRDIYGKSRPKLRGWPDGPYIGLQPSLAVNGPMERHGRPPATV